MAWTGDVFEGGTDPFVVNSNATIFTGGGSKDPIDVNQWAWKDGAGGLPDKDNLSHAFAARYSLPPSATCPSGGAATCEVIFFGSDRLDNSGDAQQGFWFFQNRISLGTNSVGGGTGFIGVHSNGDLLVISDFSNGGTTSTISVFRWDTTCTATNKPDPTCADSNLRTLATSAAANCATAASNDGFCGIVNSSTITMPWPFTDKSNTPNNGALNGEFFEGGVNLSLLGLGNECFSSIGSETRSSTSTSAVLKDFVIGTFGNCQSGLTTTPVDLNGSPIPSGGFSIGTGSVSVKDSANLIISGVTTWAGTVRFFLCGPTPGLCTSPNGTQIGGDIPVNNTTSLPILSNAAIVTSAGTYCWRGEFISGTNGVPNSTDASAGECFTVNPVTPAMMTSATGSVLLGQPISDTATLSLTANEPGTPVINPTTQGGPAGGSITFRVFGPSPTPVCVTPVFTSLAIPVSGNGTYGPVSFIPNAAGTYYWVATYTGDPPNTTGPISGGCGESFEVSIVTPRQPAISTIATPGPVPLGTAIDDVATLTGTANRPSGTPAGGTITFSLYGPSAQASCTTAIATRVVNVSGDGAYTASAGSTGTGSLTPTAAGTYYWIAVYSGDPPNTLGVSGTCGGPNEASVVIQLQPTISTAQTFTLKDSATITIASGGAGNLAGNVRFRLYNNSTCSPAGVTIYDSSLTFPSGIPVSGSGAFPQSVTVNSETVVFTTTQPTLSWLVEYTSTNNGQQNVTSSCNTENANLTINNGQ